jgi:translation initiation factor 5
MSSLKPEMLNIGKNNSDPFYRYKMPVIISQKTSFQVLVNNIDEVAKSLERSPESIAAYFKTSLKTTVQYKKNALSINGSYDNKKLQQTLEKYISEFVLCKCGLPELNLSYSTKKDKVKYSCRACGNTDYYKDSDNKSILKVFKKEYTKPGKEKKIIKNELDIEPDIV